LPSAKSGRVAERRRQRNGPLRSRARTFINKARELVESDDSNAAEKAVREAVLALDRAAQKGAIHKKNASRRKSRLMRLLNASASK